MVALRGARLELESPDVSVRARTFAVHTTEKLSLESEGAVRIDADEVRALTKQDIHLNGAYIRLNCTADAPPPEEILAEMQALAMAAAPAEACAASHGHAAPGVDPDRRAP